MTRSQAVLLLTAVMLYVLAWWYIIDHDYKRAVAMACASGLAWLLGLDGPIWEEEVNEECL